MPLTLGKYVSIITLWNFYYGSIVKFWLTCFRSMKCTSLNAMQKGHLLQADCSMTCELHCVFSLNAATIFYANHLLISNNQ